MCRPFCIVHTAEKKTKTFSTALFEIHLDNPEPPVTLAQEMTAFMQTGHSVVIVTQFITKPHPHFSRRIQQIRDPQHREARSTRRLRSKTSRGVPQGIVYMSSYFPLDLKNWIFWMKNKNF